MDQIMAIAARHELQVIEDCAHSIETEFRGQQAGTFGEFGCFSFYATKNVATGEGGMVIARTPESVDRIKVLSLHGMSRDAWHRFGDSGYKHYQVVEAGFKYNMMDLQAAIGIHQLARVEASWLRRQEIWTRYQREFANLPLGLPAEPAADTRHAYHLYTITVAQDRCGITRDAFIDRMTKSKVGVGVHYQSLAQHPYYVQRFGWRPSEFPAAEEFGSTTVSLPISPKLSDSEVDYIIESVVRNVSR
jgi:dTDP-4-amino-4,6-dideoxygalactose transaminase